MNRYTSAAIKTMTLVAITFSMVKPCLSQAMPPRQNVGILIFDDVQIIDYTGPYEVFAAMFNVYTVAASRDTIRTAGNMKVIPDYVFGQHPKPDILIIPGGGGRQPWRLASKLPYVRNIPTEPTTELIQWVKANAKDANYVLSVCNGAFILAHAGLLDGLSATCTAGMLDNMKEYFPKVNVVGTKKFVDNGKILTSAGLSSGIDASLHLLEKIFDRGTAQNAALGLEYNWDPDGNWTRAALADKYLRFQYDVKELSSSLSRQGDSKKWENKWLVEKTTPEQALLIMNTAFETGATYGNGFKPKWVKGKSSATSTDWSFSDENGDAWRGVASAVSDSSPGNSIMSIAIQKVERNESH